jgi:hypothetical protein
VSGRRAFRNASTLVAIVGSVLHQVAPPGVRQRSFLQAFQNRLGTLGIISVDPKLRHRMPRIDDPEAAEVFAHNRAANPLVFV